MDQLLNSILGSQGISIFLLLGGLLIFIYVMIGPTLWRDWLRHRERQRKIEHELNDVIENFSNASEARRSAIQSLEVLLKRAPSGSSELALVSLLRILADFSTERASKETEEDARAKLHAAS